MAAFGGRMSVADRRQESPAERIRRLVAEGRMTLSSVRQAEAFWRERLQEGVAMPDGERATVALDDLYHLIVDTRIGRKPWRIERVLSGIFEIHTAEYGRRIGFSRWQEDSKELLAYVILQSDNRVRTIHIVNARRMRREMRKGTLIWGQ